VSKHIWLCLVGWLFAQNAAASPITLTLLPSSLSVTSGQTVSIDVLIGNLDGTASVGSFDLTVSYDAGLVTPVDVIFGMSLGDSGLFEALTDVRFAPGSIELAEVSLLSDAELRALQSSMFSLASISFTATNSGTANFAFTAGIVDDAFGNKLIAVPEPSLIVLFAIGLLGGRRLRGRATQPRH
jgi:hypothetical protein